MNIQQALAKVVEGQSLSQSEMADVMEQIMTGQATDAQIGGLLVALRVKGEVVDEIAGAAQVMRALATPVTVAGAPQLVDTCGTGGDGANLFNVSTACAFVAAASGVKVAKHGNRSITSSTGSADVLEALGVNLNLSAEQVARAVSEVGVGFMFAPAHHSAMKHAIGPRKELGLRTLFNVLGPLTNPAGAKRQVIGVFNPDLCVPLAEVLKRLGSEHVLVVHAASGLDEIDIAGPTHVAELKDAEVTEYDISPEALGIEPTSTVDLVVSSAEESLALIQEALSGRERSERGDKAAMMIAVNAAAALYVGGAVGSLKDGVAMAEDAISTGLAAEKMKELAEFSTCLRG